MIVDEIDLDLYEPKPDEEEDEDEKDDDVDMRAPDDYSDVPMGDIDMKDVQSEAQASMANRKGTSLQATHWCLIYSSDGALEVRGYAYGYPQIGMLAFSRTRYGSMSRHSRRVYYSHLISSARFINCQISRKCFSPHFDLLPGVLPDAPAHQDTKPE